MTEPLPEQEKLDDMLLELWRESQAPDRIVLTNEGWYTLQGRRSYHLSIFTKNDCTAWAHDGYFPKWARA